MNWNDHSKLKGMHAFLSPSKYTWVTNDIDKVIDQFYNQHATEIGTVLHELAAKLISFGIKLNKTDRHIVQFYLLDHGIPQYAIDTSEIFTNFVTYVNDAISFGMDAEVILKYSDDCYGTADAIFAKGNELRIHDLKTGSVPAHMEQLYIYAALYCLEYKKKPSDLTIELRLYQNEEVLVCNPDPNDISDVMQRIVTLCPVLIDIKRKGE